MKKSTLHIYCTPGIRLKLEALAKANHRTLSSEVQAMIELSFNAHTQKLAAPKTTKE